MLERSVEAAFIRAGASRGVWCLKLKILGHAGFPDRVCLALGGRVAFAELKRPGKKPRELQVFVHNILRDFGFLVEVIDHPSQCAGFFERWLGA